MEGVMLLLLNFLMGEVLPTLQHNLPAVWIDGPPRFSCYRLCVFLSPGGKHNRKFDYRIMWTGFFLSPWRHLMFRFKSMTNESLIVSRNGLTKWWCDLLKRSLQTFLIHGSAPCLIEPVAYYFEHRYEPSSSIKSWLLATSKTSLWHGATSILV